MKVHQNDKHMMDHPWQALENLWDLQVQVLLLATFYRMFTVGFDLSHFGTLHASTLLIAAKGFEFRSSGVSMELEKSSDWTQNRSRKNSWQYLPFWRHFLEIVPIWHAVLCNHNLHPSNSPLHSWVHSWRLLGVFWAGADGRQSLFPRCRQGFLGVLRAWEPHSTRAESSYETRGLECTAVFRVLLFVPIFALMLLFLSWPKGPRATMEN